MNAEQLRETILDTVAAVAPRGLTAGAVLRFVTASGFPDLTADQLAAELDYLEQKQLLLKQRAPLAAGVVHWKLAAAGREYLEAKGT